MDEHAINEVKQKDRIWRGFILCVITGLIVGMLIFAGPFVIRPVGKVGAGTWGHVGQCALAALYGIPVGLVVGAIAGIVYGLIRQVVQHSSESALAKRNETSETQ